MKEGKISVVIPVYKVEPYIRKCLESVLKGKYHNLEVICVNDGSPDHCLEIMKEMAENDPRLVVIDQENQGVAAARNKGLEQATGDYIAFIDSDDFVHPEYFRSMMKCMQEKQADIVICGADTFNEGEEAAFIEVQKASYHRLTSQELFKSYYARHMVWGRIYRKELLVDRRFTSDVRMADDTLFNLNVLRHASDPIIYETRAVFYYYLIRQTSIVRSSKAECMLDMARWYLNNREESLQAESKWGWLLPFQAFKLALSYRYMIMYKHNRKELTREVNLILAELLKDINGQTDISVKEKIIHKIMFRFPALYRQWRIKDDPTLLEWERNQKVQEQAVE